MAQIEQCHGAQASPCLPPPSYHHSLTTKTKATIVIATRLIALRFKTLNKMK